MDRITASQQRLAFAKVCVELEASMEVIRSIEVEVRNGKKIHVTVEYPWMPLKCSHCGIFGHGDKTCYPKMEPISGKVWVPKKVDKEEKTQEGKKVNNTEDSELQQIKGKEKANEENAPTSQASSINKFSILESVMEESEPPLPIQGEFSEAQTVAETRKSRVAAAGVADLMKTLRPKKRGQPGKVKKKQIGPIALGGQSSLTPT